jgi:methionyl-tRNA synthetase
VEPWRVVKEGKPGSEVEVQRIIFQTAEAVRIAAILLQPYMPTKAREMLDILGVRERKRGFADAVVGADLLYGKSKVPSGRKLGKGSYTTLFPPLLVEG